MFQVMIIFNVSSTNYKCYVDLLINEKCCNFIMLIYKSLQTIIAIITKSKVIELFCMAICFCKFLMQ